MFKINHILALIALPFMHCLSKRIAINNIDFINYLKSNGTPYVLFFFSIGLTCFALLKLENHLLWRKVFDFKKQELEFWILAPGIASGTIASWNAKSLVFDCVLICY